MPPLTRREIFSLGGAALVPSSASVSRLSAAQPAPRHFLASTYPLAKVAAVLLPRAQWRPFAPASDRAAWEAIPGDIRSILVEAGRRHLQRDWPSLAATVFLDFQRDGNRSRYEQIRDARRHRVRDLVIAECVEGQGRFLDDLLNGLWLTCEETWWGVPAHLSAQKAGIGLPDIADPVLDLFAAETGALVAWSHYLLAPQLTKLSPLVPERLRLEVDRRILTPYRDRSDFGWMGLAPRDDRRVNNWNPWINSNCLACTLLLDRDETRRRETVHKALRSLDVFLDSYQPDGGCDEGPSYWGRAGASLLDCLELLHSASRGAIDVYADPLIREIGRYLYRAHIAEDWYVNFADASAKVSPPAGVVFRYGQRIGDAKLRALGAYAFSRAAHPFTSDSIGRQLSTLFDAEALRAAPHDPPLVRDAWLPGIQVMTARCCDGSEQGLYLAAQGGHNAESHNHNDVGNFIVYSDGAPAIIDVGVETYTAKTFSAKRYEIWTMQSAFHNLPSIGGVMQSAGREFAARDVVYRADEAAAEFSLDLAGAYPPEAGLSSWKRTLRLDRAKNEIRLSDAWSLRQSKGPLILTLMTLPKPELRAPGEIFLSAGRGVTLHYDRALAAKVEEIALADGRLRGSWGERLYRILFTIDIPPARGSFAVRIAGA